MQILTLTWMTLFFSPEVVVEEEVIQGKEGEANIHEPAVDTAITQEPIVEIEAYPRKTDIQESVNNTIVTQEPVVEMEIDQEDKEIVTKSTNEVVVTQEPIAEV